MPQEVGRGGVGFRGIGGEVRGLYGQQGFFCSPSVLPSSNDADPRCLPLSPPTPSLGKTRDLPEAVRYLIFLFSFCPWENEGVP